MLFITDKFSVTPGFRLEYIKTESRGVFTTTNYNLAGEPINREEMSDDRTLERGFVLLGMGSSYHHGEDMEVYANVSQNYRSVTFSDIRVVSPTFSIDPDIRDEKGLTADVGVRGKWQNRVSYDAGIFGLKYNDRIGTIFEGDRQAERVRKNIGDAIIYGAELFADYSILSNHSRDDWRLSVFVNTAITSSKYTSSEENNIVGKQVEFIPLINMKNGIKFGYKGFCGSIQYTYLSKQFTDAENSEIASSGDNREGVIGEIPSYDVMDLSLSYHFKNWKLESGINNVLNNSYFTRRATGYPGPGIIPSDPRTFYVALEFKLSTRQ